MTKFALIEEVLQTTGTILQHCSQLGAEYARSIIQHRATRHAINISIGTVCDEKKSCEKWCLVVLGAVLQSHGLLYVESFALIVESIFAVDQYRRNGCSEYRCAFVESLLDCITLVHGPSETTGWQSDCNALFEKLQQQTKRLVPGQATILNYRRYYCPTELQVRSTEFGYLRGDMPSRKNRSLGGFKTETERRTIEESAVRSDSCLILFVYRMKRLPISRFGGIVYLSPSIRAAAWLFIDATTHVLSMAIQRLTTGLVRSQCLEKSLLNCFSSLRDVYDARWEIGEVDSVLELLKICSSDRWSQEQLLESVLELPQGLLHLFELVRTAPSHSAQVVTFLIQHVHDIRHKTQRIGELEMSAILSIIKRNVAGRVGDTSQRKWREVSGSEMLRCALEILKLFVRRKNYADLCSDLGGISILYDVLCAPSQYEEMTHLALEMCCYLAGVGADLTHENFTFALQLLFVSVETSVDSSRLHLAVLVLGHFLAVDVSALSLPLIQQCRTQIVPASSRSDEEAEIFIQQLYNARQRLATRKPQPQVSGTNTGKSSLNEGEIRRIILSTCRTIVQCTDGQGQSSYVNVKTSEKSISEPHEYTRLREAIDRLSCVLDDFDMVMNRSYVSPLVSALSDILVFHTITTGTMCTIMQVLEQISFVSPSIVLSNEQLNFPALFASCSLHHRSSLPFARNLCRFCNSIGAELTEGKFGLAVSLVPLLLEQLLNWKTDLEIVDQSLATLPDLIAVMRTEAFERLHCGDVLALLNAAVATYTSNSPTSWNWLKCMLAILNKLDNVTIESAQETIYTVIGIIRMFMSHSFMVEKALLVLIRMYLEKRQLPVRHLSESDGVDVLLTCLKLHPNDESIVRGCLKLMVSLASLSETLPKTIDLLLTAEAAAPILLVSKKNPDNPSICGMCFELVHQMVKSFEKQPGKKPHVSILPGDMSRKKAELLTHLLEADIIPLIFDLLDSYSSRGDNCLLDSLLLLLKSLTKDERLRDSAEVLHGLQELQQTIDRIWEKNVDCGLVELAIDSLVNMACSDRAIGHGWRKLPMWLLQLAESIHNLETQNTGMCVEKLIGILGRLAVDSATSKTISPKGSFTILELLAGVGSDYSLEQALYGLLCALCEDIACAQILIVYNAIPITAERIICHVDDEDTLLNSLDYRKPSLSYRKNNTRKSISIRLPIDTNEAWCSQSDEASNSGSNPQKPFHDLLRGGAKFRVIWEARPDTVESIQIQLAPSGDYLLFRRKASSQLPRVERIFVSQLEVCPQRSLTNPGSPSSPSKRILAQSLLREHFEGDRVLRLKVRDEDVLIKTSSTRERVHWGQALQWLVSHRETRTPPMQSPMHSP
ncbi:Armadillo-type fold [Phytophthora cactorum]|nr:Armadillo-type fold [Phytophthora cactorum]